jgi:hypothetical protein
MLIGSCFREVVPEKMAAAMFVLSQIFEHQFGLLKLNSLVD